MTDLLDLLNDPDPQPEPERFARKSDPGPSKDAASKGDSFGPLCVRVLTALVEVERTNRHWVGATAHDIQMLMEYQSTPAPDRNSISRRLTSLLRRGFVRDTGERRDGGRGISVTVYAATAAGREWLR